jgi:hypothetical protein
MIQIEIDTMNPRREHEIAEAIKTILDLLPEQHAISIR